MQLLNIRIFRDDCIGTFGGCFVSGFLSANSIAEAEIVEPGVI